jgi:hypothetical protein
MAFGREHKIGFPNSKRNLFSCEKYCCYNCDRFFSSNSAMMTSEHYFDFSLSCTGAAKEKRTNQNRYRITGI